MESSSVLAGGTVLSMYSLTLLVRYDPRWAHCTIAWPLLTTWSLREPSPLKRTAKGGRLPSSSLKEYQHGIAVYRSRVCAMFSLAAARAMPLRL